MFGNLFNQKKVDENGQPAQGFQTQQPGMNQPFQPQMPQQQMNPAWGSPAMQAPQMPMAGAQMPPQAPVADPNTIGATMDPSKRENLNALSRLDPRTTEILSHATAESKRIKQAFIEPDQLLFGLLYDGDIFKLIEANGADAAAISKEIQTKEQIGTYEGQPTLSEATKKVFDDAYSLAKNRGSGFITPEDILMALFSSATGSVLQEKGVDKKQIEEKLSKNADYATGKKSVLDKYGIDLTEEAKEGKLDPITGRDKEIERLIHILLRRSKNNPIIIGEAGTGKTAVVEALAQKIVANEVPKQLQGKRIIQLELSSLVAGASHRGEFEDRLRNVIKEVQISEGQIILFIDEIHTVIGAGDSGGALDASNIIKPYLARGQLQLIGTTTTAEYRKYFEKDKAFQRRFQPIIVNEPDEETALKMMEIVKPKYEKFHEVVFTPDALESSVKLSKKYIGERYLPDKAVDLIDEAAAEVKLAAAAGTRQDKNVNRSDIEKVVSAWTGIPITRLTEDESQKLLNLEKLIHERFIDQEQAVAAVAEAVRRGRIGLAAANRPIASFIFLGPTGVGKTELAKTLAELLFGRDDAMIRLDMSEYMEKHEVAKLIGAPPGYVGYEEGGQLTEAVRAKPYSIVLLDEVEKAHPDVYNILLQLLEDGRLTDNKGNTISFKNTIIIATSNIGSQLIQKFLMDKQEKEKQQANGAEQTPQTPQVQPQQPAGAQQPPSQSPENLQMANKSNDELSKLLMDELHKFFKPELLNRFDDLVMFKPLEKKDMKQIAKLGIGKTQKLLKEQGFEIQITDLALSHLADEGYDPLYGARPLRRLIQSAIENPIALLVIGKNFSPGDTILIDYDQTKQQFVFTKAAVAQQPAGAQQPGTNPPQAAGVQPPVQPNTAAGMPQYQAPQQGVNPAAYPQGVPQQPQQAMPQQPVVDPDPMLFPNPSQLPQSPPPAPPTNGSNGTAMQPSNGVN